MDQMIKPECVDFKALIMQNDNISVNYKSKMIETLTKEFTEEESKWYIANLYVYMNYHPTNDYPINLDTLVKIAGFAHKKNAKRTLENNFTKDEDYKIRVLPKEQSSWGGSGGEEIMLNTDTFKNMCMLVKTEKAKEIRKYYVKLENIYNGIVKEEIREQKILQENTRKLLEEKENQFEKEKDNIILNSFNKKNIVYFIQVDKFTIKFGETADIIKRFSDHRRDYGDQIKILYILESLDKKRLETLIKRHIYIKHRLFAKIFNEENKTELIKVDDKFNIKNIIRIANQLNDTINFNTEDKREHDLEMKKLHIEEIEANTKNIEANNNKMSIELEFKKLELSVPINQTELQTQITQLTNENKKLLEELTELKNWKSHRLIRNRGMKEKAEQNKEKFIKWLSENVIKNTGSFLKMDELSNKFLGHTTSTQVIGIYRDYLEEYLLINYPEINNKYIQKAKNGCGYRDIRLK